MAAQWSGVRLGDGAGDDGPPVTALGDVAVIAEPCHEARPLRSDLFRAPTGSGGFAREAEAGKRRAHHVKGIFRLATVLARVGERLDDLQELDHRSGPAVGHNQREGAFLRRGGVDEVDLEAVERCQELREPVDGGFATAPVVVALPVIEYLAHVGERDALGPVVRRFRLGQAGPCQSGPEIFQRCIVDGDLEGSNLGHGSTFLMFGSERCADMSPVDDDDRTVHVLRCIGCQEQ